MSGSDGLVPTPGHVGAAGEAAVKAALLARGFIVAKPEPDAGVDLVVLSDDFSRAVPIQVKSATTRGIQFQKAWFTPVDVVLVQAWLTDSQVEFFVFDGQRDVERFLGPESVSSDSWAVQGIYAFTAPRLTPQRHARLQSDFRDRWSVIHKRLGAQVSLPPATVDGGRYRLTRHARERIEAGEVQEAWIAATLDGPDRDEDDPLRPGIRRAWKRIEDFGGRSLRVAYRQDGVVTVVITAFFDRGAPS